MMKHVLLAAALALAACSQPAPGEAPAPAPVAVEHDAPAGAYTLDASHASLDFRVDHIGFSNYTARFADFTAALQFDPADPAAMSVSATINVNSLELPAPPAGFKDTLLGPQWFDAAQFPQMTFQSTAVERTGPNTARITGDFTLRGVTRPVSFDAVFNGGYAGHALEPNARIGFSARGTLDRSDFGMDIGIPPPGSTMGVSDDVEFIIEAEFTGPPWTAPAE